MHTAPRRTFLAAAGPQLVASSGPRHNSVLFDSMCLKHCEGSGATCIYNTVLKTSIACRKRMQRNFRTKDVYLDKTESPEHRNKLNLRVQNHNFIPPNTNFLVKKIIPQSIPTFINFYFLQITTIMLFPTKINISSTFTLYKLKCLPISYS